MKPLDSHYLVSSPSLRLESCVPAIHVYRSKVDQSTICLPMYGAVLESNAGTQLGIYSEDCFAPEQNEYKCELFHQLVYSMCGARLKLER